VTGPSALQLRIWERGAGETLACGTGACASAVAAIASRRLSEPDIAVSSRGGTLQIAWREDGEITMTGPAQVVYEGGVRAVTSAL
jgi:diaminopimelate epimerase